MNRWQKFWDLSPGEKKTFIFALICLPAVKIGLYLYGFEGLLARLQRTPVHSPDSEVDRALFLDQTPRLVNSAARFIFKRESCLERSIFLWWLLRRNGITSDVRIGVAKDDVKLRAHAWVEIDGMVINDHVDIEGRFSSFSTSFITETKDGS